MVSSLVAATGIWHPSISTDMARRSNSDWLFGTRMQIRPDRQTLLWSATWPKDVQAIARDFLKDPYQAGAEHTADPYQHRDSLHNSHSKHLDHPTCMHTCCLSCRHQRVYAVLVGSCPVMLTSQLLCGCR